MNRILVIDDNDLVRATLRDALAESGFQVLMAENANDGYRVAIESLPDLILLDVQLPDVNGFDVIRILRNREELQNTPIIMITGSANSTAEKVRGFQAGAVDYIAKPFEVPELIERVKAQLRARRIQAPPPQAPAPAPSPASIESPSVHKLSGHETVASLLSSTDLLLFSPEKALAAARLPPLTIPFLVIVNALVLMGWILGVKNPFGPVMTLLFVTLIWSLVVAIVVIGGSILGISLKWKDGANLVSGASLPLLLKLSGAVLFSAWTTLSFTRFSLSPALIFSDLPSVFQRLDLFEIWALALLSLLLMKSGGDSRRAAGLAGLVWLVGVVLTWMVS